MPTATLSECIQAAGIAQSRLADKGKKKAKVNDHKIAVGVEDERIKSHIIEELSTYQNVSQGDGKLMATQKEDVKLLKNLKTKTLKYSWI